MVLLLYLHVILKSVQSQKIKSTFLIRLGASLIKPIEIARKHGLSSASNVIVEENENGILIKSNKI